MEYDNQRIIDDAREIREKWHPRSRAWGVRAKSDSIRVKFPDSDVFDPNQDVFGELNDRGYTLEGGNFDTGLLVFEPSFE